MQGTDNQLTITPELNIARSSACQHIEEAPGFYLGAGSKITINTAENSPTAELSTLTATGAPFSIAQGTDTLIVLPARSSRDYQASLKLMAKLAKTSGSSWAQADIQRASNLSALDLSKNILFIGPSSQLNRTLLEGAPKSLLSALKGKKLNGNSYDVASTERFAGTSAAQTFELYAASQARLGSIRQGGVAALYPSKAHQGKVIGVITNTAGIGFSTIANQFVKRDHWNKVEGSVARWNSGQVLMAQTAMHVPNFKPAAPASAKGFELPEISLAKFDLPKFDLPKFDLPSFDKGAFEFGEIDSASVKAKFSAATKALSGKIAHIRNAIPSSHKAATANPVSAVPKLRGFSKIEAGPKSSWLSGAAQSLSEKINKAGISDKLKSLRASLKKKSEPVGPGASLFDRLTAHPFAPFIFGLGTLFIFLGFSRPKPHHLSNLRD